jgi:hypothetical protein
MSNLLFTTGYLLLILFANYPPENNTAKSGRNYTVFLSGKSRLTIHGSTNVSRFQYQYTKPLQPDRISIEVQNTPRGLHFSDAVIQLQSAAFKCGQAQMDRDLQKLLLADQHPYITILLKKVALTHQTGNSQQIQSEVEITMAGVTRQYLIPMSVANSAAGYTFSGKLALDICEFGLEPPKVMMGLVTIKDNVDIKFNLQAFIKSVL